MNNLYGQHSDNKHWAVTHGMSITPEYIAWANIKQRCCNPNNPSFFHYGSRGISVCDRWAMGDDKKSGFEYFLEDMGKRPSPELSIDRIDNDGNYEPSNCRWATQSEQVRNSRRTKRIGIPPEILKQKKSAYREHYYAENRATIATASLNYYRKNKEKILAKMKAKRDSEKSS